MLHHTKTLARESLRAFPVPIEAPFLRNLERRGNTSRHWQPIQHGELADCIVERLEAAGLGVLSERWAICRKGHGLVGSVDIEVPKMGAGRLVVPQGMLLSFGVRHSNDGNWALTCLVGARVEVCSNGFVADTFAMSRKHTGFELAQIVDQAIDVYLEHAPCVAAARAELEAIELTVSEGDSLLLTMADEGAYPWRLVRRISEQWRVPTHAAFEARNAWSLYMAVSEVAKDRSPQDQITTLDAARGILTSSSTWLEEHAGG